MTKKLITIFLTGCAVAQTLAWGAVHSRRLLARAARRAYTDEAKSEQLADRWGRRVDGLPGEPLRVLVSLGYVLAASAIIGLRMLRVLGRTRWQVGATTFCISFAMLGLAAAMLANDWDVLPAAEQLRLLLPSRLPLPSR